MEKATEPDKPADQGDGKRGSTKSKLTIHEEIFISKCQVVRLLNTGHDDFLAEVGEVLRAELSSSTGSRLTTRALRHKATRY